MSNAGERSTEGTRQSSYGGILKSSAIVGGSSFLNVLIGIVRTKGMAIMLGPTGVGLLGMYGAVFDLALSIAGMGVNSSGVRQIAEAAGSGDTERIARTIAVLRRTTLFLSVLGAVVLAALAPAISEITFGDTRYAGAIALLALAVLLRVVSDSQGALIQGMRRIGDLAKMNILGGIFSTFVSLSIVYVLGEQGIVPSLVGLAALTLATSWWYSRKIPIRAVLPDKRDLRHEQLALLKLGLVFMSSGLMMMGASYLIRLIVLRKVGVEAAGLYQSAWALGGMYVGFVLQAMGTDFYPRLTAVARDNAECNRLVNEQAEISLLLAGPGIIATLVLAPAVISLFYTADFQAAVGALRWLCLGMALRIVSWPMGFIIVAKGAQGFFFWSETVWTAVYLGLAWVCVDRYGLDGAGIAFFGAYILHCFIVYGLVRRLSDFTWSAANLKNNLIYLPLIGLVFGSFYVLPYPLAFGFGTVAVLLGGLYSLRTLVALVASDRLPRSLRRMLNWMHPAVLGSEKSLEPPASRVGKLLNIGFLVCLILALVGGLMYWYRGIYDWTVQNDFWELVSRLIQK